MDKVIARPRLDDGDTRGVVSEVVLRQRVDELNRGLGLFQASMEAMRDRHMEAMRDRQVAQ